MDAFDPLYIRLLVALCGFLALVAATRHYAPSTPLPAESWLLLAGIGYGWMAQRTTGLPALQLAAELILGMILPVLIFSAGRHLPVGLLVRSAAPVSLLVVLGTTLSVIVIGLPLAWVLGIPLVHGLLFGAALAATDPTSVGQLLGRFRIPERLRLLLHGESIFNDSITVVLFTALAAALLSGSSISLFGIGVEAGRSMLLAVPVGLLSGWMMGLLVRHWREQNRVPGLTLTLALAIAAFLLSEKLLHASGIIAVLCAALAFSHTRQGCDHGLQLYDELWGYLGSLAASVLYFALGAAMATQAIAPGWTLAAVPLLFLASRALLAYGSGPVLRLAGRPLPRGWRHIIMLGGIRGAVPAALVLMMPADYAYRDALLGTVFTLVAYGIVVHPLLLRGYLQRHPVDALADDAPAQASDNQQLPAPLKRLLETTAWGPAAIAGAIAGVVFLALELAMVPLFQGLDPWVPVRMIAAIGLGVEVLPPPATPALDVALVALLVHFTLSLVYGWVLAPFIERATLPGAVLRGLAFGLAVYLVNFYLFTAMFPWFSEARNWISIVAHLAFGSVLAGTYMRLRHRG